MAEETEARERALQELPSAYSLAVRLRDAGCDDTTLCDYLDIPLAALASFMDVAEAKLAAIMQRHHV